MTKTNDSAEKFSPLYQLTRARVVDILRDPGTLFWVFGFPLVLAFVLGIAFRNRPPDPIRVAVVGNTAWVQALSAPTFQVQDTTDDDARLKLRRGEVDLVVEKNGEREVRYRFDETRAEARVARLAVERQIERAHKRTDMTVAVDEKVTEPGSRYIDFLLPGLIGMNLMGSSMWGIGYNVVEARKRKLLKRLAATPMKRSDYLLSIVLWRLLFLCFEVVILAGIGRVAFGVAIQGSFMAVGVLSILGGFAFTGIALLVGARVTSTEAAQGWLNFIQMPMWLLSGAFFSAARFPEEIQPLIRLLPLTALNDSLRAVINEGASLGSQWGPAAILAAWGVIPFAIALRTFKWQ